MSFDIYIPTPEKKILSWDGPGPEMGVEGWYRFVLKNRDGSIARDTGWFKNLITNNGMARIVNFDGGSVNWATYMSIGDGSGTPDFTDTALFGSQLGARKLAATSVSGWTSTYFYRRYTHRWPTGEGTGTISEVGYHTAGTAGTMFSHALLVDSGGSPTSIVKGADQSLDVYYELRNYPNMSDASGTIDISGTSYDYVLRPYAFHNNVGSTWTVNTIERLSVSTVQHYAYTGKGLLAILTEDQNDGGGTSLGLGAFGVTYAKGSYYTDNYIEANIDYWNGTIDWVATRAGNTSWQFTLSKTVGGGGLVKTDEERLRLHIRLTAARH